LSLTGKTTALPSKAPDPYNPKPHTWLDTLREKFTFRTGGLIETVAFGMVGADAFMNKKISFKKGGKQYRDYISGIGGTLFTIRYLIRYWAPFGIKEMNMDEMYAHVTDSLAKMPPGKLPQLMAETAADLTDHFKDKHLEYGKVFTQLMNELYRYHHIALDNLGTEPEERRVKMTAHLKNPDPKPDETPVTKHTLTHAPRTAMDRVTVRSDKHSEKVSNTANETPLGMGA